MLSNDLLIHSSGDHIVVIVDHIYPSILDNMHDPSFFEHRAILTPKNIIVDEINDHVMSLILGEENAYLSGDSPCSDSRMVNRLVWQYDDKGSIQRDFPEHVP